MRGFCALALLGLLLLPARATAGRASPAGRPSEEAESALARNPYRYAARQALVEERRREGRYESAYWHAAWLTWLSCRQYADSDEGAAFLRDRGNRDRAAASEPNALSAVIGAVDAERLLYRSCLGGAIAQQAGRLRGEIADLLADAEEREGSVGQSDPVARMALVRLGIALDDAIVLDTDGGGERRLRGGASRLSVLRTAASRAETVAAWLPEAPGPHRLLAVIRARLAEMDGRGELWELAIAEANRGYELDPADPYLAELLWTLHLRAGDWAEAEAWQARVEAAARAMSEGVEGHGGAGPGGKGGSGVE